MPADGYIQFSKNNSPELFNRDGLDQNKKHTRHPHNRVTVLASKGIFEASM
jgi:hypothetical protein